jgi:hypothetical protein
MMLGAEVERVRGSVGYCGQRREAQLFNEWKRAAPRCGRGGESEGEWQRAEEGVFK